MKKIDTKFFIKKNYAMKKQILRTPLEKSILNILFKFQINP